jgi:divalent metal cation (Fe/Co/Zn/Cd) transporter
VTGTTTLHRRAARLAWATVAYNTVEGVVAIAAGAAAGSVALVSFGLDSAVEVLSALAVGWQFAGGGVHAEEREQRTLRLIALAFFALAAYVAQDAVRSLAGGADPDASPVGIALAAASLVVMPLLTAAKRRTGRALGSATVLADSTQTLLCAWLSGVLLAGLLLNALVGWGWADPLAGLVIAAVAVREGVEAWRGDHCCEPTGVVPATRDRS